jgi:hypothetical protein
MVNNNSEWQVIEKNGGQKKNGERERVKTADGEDSRR